MGCGCSTAAPKVAPTPGDDTAAPLDLADLHRQALARRVADADALVSAYAYEVAALAHAVRRGLDASKLKAGGQWIDLPVRVTTRVLARHGSVTFGLYEVLMGTGLVARRAREAGFAAGLDDCLRRELAPFQVDVDAFHTTVRVYAGA